MKNTHPELLCKQQRFPTLKITFSESDPSSLRKASLLISALSLDSSASACFKDFCSDSFSLFQFSFSEATRVSILTPRSDECLEDWRGNKLNLSHTLWKRLSCVILVIGLVESSLNCWEKTTDWKDLRSYWHPDPSDTVSFGACSTS